MNPEYDSKDCFKNLTLSEQLKAIVKMRRDGHTEGTISHATGISVEQIREVLGATECASCD